LGSLSIFGAFSVFVFSFLLGVGLGAGVAVVWACPAFAALALTTYEVKPIRIAQKPSRIVQTTKGDLIKRSKNLILL
jgi:hypothetical protein